MKDNHGDEIGVYAATDVYMTVYAGTAFADAALTPKKARKLARKLNKAAAEIEGSVRETSSVTADGDFEVGDVVLVSDAPWVSEPGGFVAEGHAGATGTVVGFGDGYAEVEVEVAGLSQYIDPSCLTPVAEPTPVGYVVELTEDEAKTLAVLLARVGGAVGYMGSAKTARKYAAAVSGKLADLGIADGVLIGESDPRFTVDHGHADSVYFIGVAE